MKSTGKWTICGLGVLAALVLCLESGNSRADRSGDWALPPEVLDAVEGAYPEAVVEQGEEKVVSVVLYEVVIRDGETQRELVVSEDGSFLETRGEIARDALPPEVDEALIREAGMTEISPIVRTERSAHVGVVVLDGPELRFWAEWTSQAGTRVEVTLGPDGSVIERLEAPIEPGGDTHPGSGPGG